jgi:diguanylate cyclase (GGDEF)-like protein
MGEGKMTLEPLDALSRLAARRFASFADAANAVLDLLAGAVPGGCVLLGQVDWDAGECRVLDARGGDVARGSSLPLAGEGSALIGPETLASVCPGAWVSTPLDAADGSVVALLIASPGAEVAPPRYLTQLLLVASRILSYEWESISTRAELHRLAEAVRDREHTDPVTGLPNRAALLEALEREWELSSRGSVETFVVVAHLDDLSGVADRHGHAVADLIVKDVAEVLSGAVRRADHLAQVADDALAIVLVGCKGRDGACAFIGRVARALERVAAARPAPARLSYGIQDLADADSAMEAVELAEVAARAAEPLVGDSIEELA